MQSPQLLSRSETQFSIDARRTSEFSCRQLLRVISSEELPSLIYEVQKMTTRSSGTKSLPTTFRRCVALAAVAGSTFLLATTAHAQTNAASGNNQAATSAATAPNTEELFSSSIDDFSPTEGRFTENRLGTQPTAGGNTNTTQQNAFNNARNLQRLNQQFNRTNQNRNAGNTQGTRTIRPSLRLGFTPKPRPTKDLQESLGKRLKALSTRVPSLASGRPEYASVKFDFSKQGEIVLSGSVPNEDASSLLANILRMEPGVSSVRNDLKIAKAEESTPK